MGRWSQRRRAGGGPPGISAAVPDATVLSVAFLFGTTWRWSFDSPFVAAPAALVPELLIDGEANGIVSGFSGNDLDVEYILASSPGIPWEVDVAPANVDFSPAVLAVPESGITI